MANALKVLIQGSYPSLAAFKNKLEQNGIQVIDYDGYKIETKNGTFTMVEGKILREPKGIK